MHTSDDMQLLQEYADGHSESHRWQSTRSKQGSATPASGAQDVADWEWMRDRTSARAN